MSNLITKTTELAMHITLSYLKPGDIAVDATCGTGRDTLALAEAVGDKGRVYAFDIQKEAIDLTSDLLKNGGWQNAELFNESFVHMDEHVPEGSASAVGFNLGYLPGGDHAITTKAETTIEGLKAALKALRTGGIVTAVLYDGHAEGLEEKECVLKWAELLDPKIYHAVFANMLNQNNHPPEILWITKKR